MKPIIKQWGFINAGGFEQVELKTASDLAELKQLDQKLWAALACPVDTLAIDKRMLGYIDLNQDGRIRAPEIIAAVDWAIARLANPDELFNDKPLTLSCFSDSPEGQHLAASAERLLKVKGRTSADSLSSADTDNIAELFPANEPNGDGLITPALTTDPVLAQTIKDIIACGGAAKDRSGELGVSADAINAFYGQLAELKGWHDSVNEETLKPFGDNTDTAIAVIASLRDKVNDYFTRIEMVAYDPRSAQIMQSQEDELMRLSSLNLADKTELQALPIAGLQHGDVLPLTQGINPAWSELVKLLKEHAVTAVFGEQEQLTQSQWQALLERSQAYFDWQKAKPDTAVAKQFNLERVVELIELNQQDELLNLVEQDLSVKEAADGLMDLDKLLRFKESLIALLYNFVSFQNFYHRKEKAVFQAGTLYIDGKSCDLVVEVKDVAAHSAVAENSNSFLIYCECKRKGQPVNGRETMHVVAAVTAGVEHELMLGRNGLFYDRDGNDWDATVVKVIENAISVREAFWSPYKRIANLVSNQVQKFAASRDEQVISNAAAKLDNGATAEGAVPKTFDIARFAGIFAAIGLALGAIGTAAAAVFSGLLNMQLWQWPVLIIGIMLLVSGPSMLLAWFKLRRRSLGPILDANGWAVNTQAKISIPFGASLTQVAKLPKGAKRNLRDPYSSSTTGWWVFSALLIVVAASASYWWFIKQTVV